jgi:hypothetical protein
MRLWLAAGEARSCGGVAEWLRQGPAKPCTRVRFPSPPLIRYLIRKLVSRVFSSRLPGLASPEESFVFLASAVAQLLPGLNRRKRESYEAGGFVGGNAQ